MDLKTLFWEAVQAYILCNSLLKGAIPADGWLTGPASSDVNGAKCCDTLWTNGTGSIPSAPAPENPGTGYNSQGGALGAASWLSSLLFWVAWCAVGVTMWTTILSCPRIL